MNKFALYESPTPDGLQATVFNLPFVEGMEDQESKAEIELQRTPLNIVIAGYLPEVHDASSTAQNAARERAEELMDRQLEALSTLFANHNRSGGARATEGGPQITYVANGACADDVISRVRSFNQQLENQRTTSADSTTTLFKTMKTQDDEYVDARTGETRIHAQAGKDLAILEFMKEYKEAVPVGYASTSFVILDGDSIPENPTTWISDINSCLMAQNAQNESNGAIVFTPKKYDASETNLLHQAQEKARTFAVGWMQKFHRAADFMSNGKKYRKHFGFGEQYTVSFTKEAYDSELKRKNIIDATTPEMQVWNGEDQFRGFKAMFHELGSLALQNRMALLHTVVTNKEARVITDARDGKLSICDMAKEVVKNCVRFEGVQDAAESSTNEKVRRLGGFAIRTPGAVLESLSTKKYSGSIGQAFEGVDNQTGQPIFSERQVSN